MAIEKQISNNLTKLNGKWKGFSLTAQTLLRKLGFIVEGNNDIRFDVVVPAGWRVEHQGQHTTFFGPQGEELWSFIKNDPWDRNSFLEATNINMEM